MKNTIYVLTIREGGDEAVQSLCQSVIQNGFQPEVVKGVVGRQLSAGEYFDAIKPYLAATKRIMSPGEVGCVLGHLRIWEAIAEGTSNLGVVLEDDAILDGEFGDRVRRLIEFCELRDCFVSLGGQEISIDLTRSIVGRKVDGLNDTWEIAPSDFGKLYGTVGYIVSKPTARRLASSASKALFVADDYGLLHRAGVLRRILLSNVVGHPWGSYQSTIETERDFLFATARPKPRPLAKRLAEEVMATVRARFSPSPEQIVPDGWMLVEWESRFRPH